MEGTDRQNSHCERRSSKPKVILITGPTGVGKSRIAVELARAIGANIISADSMQVYRYMDIGTDKPDLQIRNEIVHHLIDIVDPDEEFNAALFREIASPLIKRLWNDGRHVIVSGGTGLYIRVLFGGIINGGSPQIEFRQRYIHEAVKKGKDFLYKRLLELDREAAQKIHPEDLFRVIRALEVIDNTGKPISIQQKLHGFRKGEYEVIKIGLMVERERLYREIEKRVDVMIEKGLVDEVRSLFERGYGLNNRSMRSIGYRHISNFILGEWDLSTAVELMKRDTRRYAKRQMTWFRSDREIQWHEPKEFREILEKVRRFLNI